MPLTKIKTFISFLFIIALSAFVFGQTTPKTTTIAELKKSKPTTPTSAEVMRNRISKAKAFLVVKNYGAAIYDLENIRRETTDKTVHRVLNVLLMHAYLEQGDYLKAQKFLKTLHKAKGSTAAIDYLAVAGQVVNGAKTQLARYKSLGLSVSDRNLPMEASSDVENMRKTLELIVSQSKAMSKDRRVSSNAFALLEETSSARSNLAKDAYDAKRWKDQVADAREQIVNPNTKIIDAVDPIESPNPNIIAVKDVKLDPVPEPVKTDSKPNETKKVPAENTVAKNDSKETINPSDRKIRVITSAKTDESRKTKKKDQPNVKSTIQKKPKKIKKKPIENNVAKNESSEDSTLDVGSLIGFATRRVNPVYPRQARNMRMTGTVKVMVFVDENGKVARLGDTKGPSLLKRAARDAVRKWRFRPFERNGQPVQAKGFVSFNFNL